MVKALIKRVTTVEQRNAVRNVLRRLRPVSETDKTAFKDRLEQFATPYRLHLGCGNIKLAGFCNVDALETVAADAIDDIRVLSRFPDQSAIEIYACHVLEHFAHDEVVPLLRRWYAVLQPGGILRISVPDLDRIVKIYYKNWEHFQKPGNTP